MSVWGIVDGVADNSLPNWSSFDEVEWIESEAKEDHVQEAQVQRKSSFGQSEDSFGKPRSLLTDVGINQMHRSTQTIDSTSSRFTEEQMNSKAHFSRSPEKTDVNIKRQSSICQNSQRSEYSDTEFRTESRSTMDGGDNTLKNIISITDCMVDDTSGTPQPNISDRADIFGNNGGSEVEPQYTTPDYDFEGEMELCKVGRSYQDAAGDVANSTCQFLLSDMYSQGGSLEFLEQENDQGRRDNLLEYGWGNTNNLEDMENMFLNNDSMLSGGFDDDSDGMLWEPPSPSGPGSMYQSLKEPVSPIFIQKDESETKVELLPCKSVLPCAKEEADAGPVEQCVFGYAQLQLNSDVETSELSIDGENRIDYGEDRPWEIQEAIEGPSRCSEAVEDEGFPSLKEAGQEIKMRQTSPLPLEEESMQPPKEGGKGSKAKKHGRRAKRLEENLKIQVPGKKSSLNVSSHAKKSPHPFVPSSQDVPLSSSSTSQITHLISNSEHVHHVQHMQPVPYIHAGYGFHAHPHHMHAMNHVVPPTQQQQQTQPVFLGYQTPYNTDPSPKISRGKAGFEVPYKSPNVGSTMTPQEKIEKLRWRQKMQARLAVEQQQQKLLNQPLVTDQALLSSQEKLLTHKPSKNVKEGMNNSVRPEPLLGAEPLVWNNGAISPVIGAVGADDSDDSFAASVLQQMLNIASKMDIRTRLCLRDGFRRLAGNALHRHAANDCGGSKSRNNEPYNWSESSSSNDQTCSQRTLTVEDIVETQTNPVDRFIAHLLFNKRCPSAAAPDYMNSTSSGNNISESSQTDLLGQKGWSSLSESMPLSEVSPSPRNSMREGSDGPHKKNQADYTSGTQSSVVSCVQLQEGSSNLRSNVTDSSMANDNLDSPRVMAT